MNDEPHIELRIPEPEDFDTEYSPYVAVPAAIVGGTIDFLQCFLAHYRAEEGNQPDRRVWDALTVAAAQALGGLMGAHGAYYHHDDTQALLEYVARFCGRSDAPMRLQAMRERPLSKRVLDAPQTGHIVDALLPLIEESERRRKERIAHLQQREAPP